MGVKKMYNDIGEKIQLIGRISGWTLLSLSALAFLVMACDSSYYIQDLCWIPLVIGVMGFISSWFICGFGQLVDNVHALRGQSVEPAAQNDELPEL
jgi:hypothetical protein